MATKIRLKRIGRRNRPFLELLLLIHEKEETALQQSKQVGIIKLKAIKRKIMS